MILRRWFELEELESVAAEDSTLENGKSQALCVSIPDFLFYKIGPGKRNKAGIRTGGFAADTGTRCACYNRDKSEET